MEKIRYGVEDPEQLTRSVLGGRRMFLADAVELQVDDCIKLIDKERLHGYGYTEDDLLLTDPLDTKKAIQHGLECFMLNQDNSKERVPDHRAYEWAVSREKLFGMPARFSRWGRCRKSMPLYCRRGWKTGRGKRNCTASSAKQSVC
ncbi:MAG: hypothetical protein K2N63_16070 [Lachnospiraceae bacterium]|nr:hypothetical protein [Lachnospiraceae bacterium]